MKRRAFITLLGGVAGMWSCAPRPTFARLLAKLIKQAGGPREDLNEGSVCAGAKKILEICGNLREVGL
jgi:hypothetical protein